MILRHNILQQDNTFLRVHLCVRLLNRVNHLRFAEKGVGPHAGEIFNRTNGILERGIVPHQMERVRIVPIRQRILARVLGKGNRTQGDIYSDGF